MQLIDNNGRTIDAEDLVDTDGSHLAFIMESIAECQADDRHGTLTTTRP